jgi:hypothetical protein
MKAKTKKLILTLVDYFWSLLIVMLAITSIILFQGMDTGEASATDVQAGMGMGIFILLQFWTMIIAGLASMIIAIIWIFTTGINARHRMINLSAALTVSLMNGIFLYLF